MPIRKARRSQPWLRRSNTRRGFTLIEVLVALAIVAIALTAGTQASNALLFNAQRQSDSLLAHLCAENALVQIRLASQMPGTGDSDSSCPQAGHVYGMTVSVFATPNPSFMRVEAHVRESPASNSDPLLTVATIVGRY